MTSRTPATIGSATDEADWIIVDNRDTGSLHVGQNEVQVGDYLLLKDEDKPRRVTYVMGSFTKGTAHACAKGTGAFPVGRVCWRKYESDMPIHDSEFEGAGSNSAVQGLPVETVAISQIALPELFHSDNVVRLFGFDSAWTAKNRGAIVVVEIRMGTAEVVVPPTAASFADAERHVARLRQVRIDATEVHAIDQPLIVRNESGSRPCEAPLRSIIGRLKGAVQPASREREDMFGAGAPIWAYLRLLGADLNPQSPLTPGSRLAIEVYPALATLGIWPAFLERKRLPNYNPARNKTFRLADWEALAEGVAVALEYYRIEELAFASRQLGAKRPNKADQDQLDSLLCLLVALVFASNRGGAIGMVGDLATGYVATPVHETLADQLERECASRAIKFRSI